MSANRRQKILWWMLNIFALSIPLSSFISIRILVLASVFGLFASGFSQVSLKLARNAWDLMLFIATLLFGLFYTTDLSAGVQVLETSFCLFALPLVFAFCVPMDKSRINKLFLMYLSGLAISSLIMIGNSSFKYMESLDISKFTYYNLTDTLGFQPTYFAYYLSFGICLLLYELYTKQLNIPRFVLFIGIVFLFVTLMLTASRTAYPGLLLIMSFFILRYFFGESERSTQVSALVSAFLLLSTLLLNHYELNTSMTNAVERTDFWERFTLWDSALKANPNPIFGVGTGDYKVVLNHYFQSQGLALFAEESFNSHNQFIQMYFSNVIFGFLVLCIIISRPLYLSFKVQNPLGILIIFPFITYGITEVFLGRYQGIVFFVFCHQLVVAKYYLIKPKLILDEINTVNN
jgi:O-antigen ligase